MKEWTMSAARPKDKKPMSETATLVTVVGTAVYAVGGTVLVFFQQVLQKNNVIIPDKYMLIAAVVLALFGGVASYALTVQQKKEETWSWAHLGNNVAISGFVAILVGLFTDGYISYQWWLGLILCSAFFKNVFLAIIPKAIEQKTKSILNIEDTRDVKTTTTRRTTRTSEPGE